MNSEFSFSSTSCFTKAEEPSLPYYLPIPGGRIIGFIPFPRVLVLCEMQSVLSRIWARVAMSISYNDNHYTTLKWRVWNTVLRNIFSSSDAWKVLELVIMHWFLEPSFSNNINPILDIILDYIYIYDKKLNKKSWQ